MNEQQSFHISHLIQCIYIHKSQFQQTKPNRNFEKQNGIETIPGAFQLPNAPASSSNWTTPEPKPFNSPKNKYQTTSFIYNSTNPYRTKTLRNIWIKESRSNAPMLYSNSINGWKNSEFKCKKKMKNEILRGDMRSYTETKALIYGAGGGSDRIGEKERERERALWNWLSGFSGWQISPPSSFFFLFFFFWAFFGFRFWFFGFEF